MSTTTVTVTTATGPVPISLGEQGRGHPSLLLHGGAGPQSVSGVAELLATTRPARVLTPTHPGSPRCPPPPARSWPATGLPCSPTAVRR